MMDAFHANLLLLQCHGLSTPPRPFDCAIRLQLLGTDAKEHLLFAHAHILGLKSASLRSQLEQSAALSASELLQQCPEALGLASTGAVGPELRQLNLDLSALGDNGLEPFKQFLGCLYGESPSAVTAPEQLLFLSKLLGVPDLELVARSLLLSRLLSAQAVSSSDLTAAAGSSNSHSTAPINGGPVPLPLYAAYLQLQQLLATQQPQQQAEQTSTNNPVGQCSQLLPLGQQLPCSPPASDSPEERLPALPAAMMMARRESASSGSSSLPSTDGPLTIVGGQGMGGDLLVPSNDKEGWCRNKKYIQIVKKGYRCLLCNKVYGRYNSVSYHVTIYHRNPPIRCEEQGCQFTTREARYIHFHKYYRHQIALPESIDLASRKCPLLSCKHVSKSPAMLDKHVQRHVADCLKEGQYVCQMCPGCNGGGSEQFTANSHELMYAHLLGQHSAESREQQSGLLSCSLSASQSGTVQQKATASGNHRPVRLGVSASAPNTPPTLNSAARFPCESCNFRARTLTALELHKAQKHGAGEPLTAAPINGVGQFPGIFGGIFPNIGFASLPGSPLSPAVTGGGGLFPVQSGLEHQSAQQLLAQLLTAQKLASALLPPQQQQQSPPPNGSTTAVNKLF